MIITSEPKENETGSETENARTFNKFEIAENKVILNSKIKEVDSNIKNANDDENIILPISQDCITIHPAIKQIIHDYNLDNFQFMNQDKTIIFNRMNRLVILHNIKTTYLVELKAEQFFQIITEIKEFCQHNNINAFSTIRIEGTSTLNSYMRICAMFRYIFKDSGITVTIYNEQHWTNEDKQQIIYEYYNTPTGGHWYVAYREEIKTQLSME